MRKKILSIFFVIFLMLLLSPKTAKASAIGNEAKINETEYTTLQEAVDAVDEGQTIQLLDNIDLVETIQISTDIGVNFTLDLNGRILNADLYTDTGCAIDLANNKTMTIEATGGGMIRGSIHIGYNGTSTSKLQLNSGTVEDNSGGPTIYVFSGNVEVQNGTVRNTSTGNTIHCYSGNVKVQNGMVSNTSTGNAIYNMGGTVLVTGGRVEAASGHAIYNSADKKITIFGTPIITSANTNNGTIYLSSGNSAMTVLEFNGGTIENTAENGTAIYNNASGRIDITPASLSAIAVISGGGMGMNQSPRLTGNTVKISTSTTYADGSGTSVISRTVIADSITSYKYLKFEKGPDNVATIGSTGYTTLQAAFDSAKNNETVLLTQDIYLSIPVTIGSDNSISFSLDLNGNTLIRRVSAISHQGSGTLSITDTASGGGKIITSEDTYSGNAVYLNGGSLSVIGGILDGGGYAHVINNEGTGMVSVSGGTVNSKGNYAAIHSTAGGKTIISGTATIISENIDSYSGTIDYYSGTFSDTVLEITGGTIENTSETGHAIFIQNSGKVSISGGRVSANQGSALKSLFSGEVIISGTATLNNSSSHGTATTIYMSNQFANATTLEITGGTIENSHTDGEAIHAVSYVDIVIPSGTIIIRGGSKAMNLAPDFNSYTGVQVKSCTDYAGATEAAYDRNNILNYRYLAFAPKTATTVSNLNLTDKLTAPVTATTPTTAYVTDDQYTGTLTWPDNIDSKFHGSSLYTATLTLTAAEGYTFSGLEADSFTYTEGVIVHDRGIGNILIVTIEFPPTAPSVLESVEIINLPDKTVYKYGESLNIEGIVVRAVYNDDTAIEHTADSILIYYYVLIGDSFTRIDIDPSLTMDDTTITVERRGIDIRTTFNITITRVDGPDAPTGLTAMAPTTYGGEDGKITGTTVLMEYDELTSFTDPTDCTETETTGLSAGNYYVRMKATTTHEASSYSIVNVPAGVTTIPVPAANTGLKWSGSEQTGVNSGIGYTLSGTDKATAVGGYSATATLQTGYSWNDSSTTDKTISWSIAKADGPATPTGLVGVAPTTSDGTDGKITGTSSLMEYADNTGFADAAECSSTEITDLSAGTYYIRIKATTTHEAGSYATIGISAGVTTIDVPTANTGLKWNGSEQTGVNSGIGYTLGGDYQATAVGNYTATATLQTGYAWDDSSTTDKTISWSIEKADGPAAPTGLTGVAPTTYGGADGKITGTTALMEYADNTGFSEATECSSTEITGLPTGIYYIRIKATTTHEAGSYGTVNVFAGVTIIAVPAANTGLKWTGSEQTGVNSGTGYTLGGDYQATTVGNYTATAILDTGYAWNDSSTTDKTISWSIARANGPAAPTGLTGVAPTTSGGTDGKITGTSTLMEYADNTGFADATECSSTEISDLSAGTYYVRIKATTTHEAGSYGTVKVFAGATTIAVPTANTGLKWNGSEQTGVNSGIGYTLDGTNKATAVSNYSVTVTLQTGYIWNDNSTDAKEIFWSIARADGPAITSVSTVGCTTPENNDGKLIGMTTTMEYKRSSNASYTSVTGSAITVTGSAITGLTSGDYMVRFSETDTHNAGPHSIFNIAAFIPAPTYTISGNIIGNDTNSGIAGAIVQLKSGGSNIRSSLYTDSSGAYTISDVIAGTYTIEVSAAGYDRGITNSFNVSSADITSNDLTLTKTVVFIPVTDITMTNGTFVRVYNNLNLTGTTIPSNASNCTITWSVDDANGTGAIITGNTFRATSEGIATVKATVINGFSVSSDYNKTFTIAVTAAPTPTPNPSPSPNLRPVERPEGIVEKDKQQEEGAPTINFNNSSDELKTSVLTQAEQVLVARGENAKIILKVTDIGSSISEEEKKLIQDKLLVENGKEKKEVDEKEAPEIAVLYIDLTLYKQVGSREQTKVTETNEKISISLEIPEEFWNTDVMKSREFYVMRIHDGEITRIDGSYDAIKQIFTFETDRFSTYALTYQDTIRITTYEGFRYLQLRVKTDKTSQILSYKRNGIVDGYLIFGGKCGEEMVELADIPAKITRYVIDDLMPRTFYKYQVKAYRIVDGERIIIMTSKVVHSILNGKTYADPKRVTLDMKSIKLTKDENKAITGQLVLPKGKKLKAHTAVIRFESSNSEIASVNSKGNISGKSEGTCYVYAYAQNGVYKRIKVTVK